MEPCPICGDFAVIDWAAVVEHVRTFYPLLTGRDFQLVANELAHWQHWGERRWDAEFLAACGISVD